MGLIGGSLALALKSAGYPAVIRGYDVNKRNAEAAMAVGAIDFLGASLDEVLSVDSGLIFVAAPLGAYAGVFSAIARRPAGKFLVTDVGSVKVYADTSAQKYMPEVSFVGGHPMAGSEKKGFWAATPHLFENAFYFLTPSKNTIVPDLEKIKTAITALGALPVILSAVEHDKIVARISHMPHIAAALIANTLATGDSINFAAFSGGGFRDTTRVAAGDPKLWQEIILQNKAEILPELTRFEQSVAELRDVIGSGDEGTLHDFLTKARFVREGLPKCGRDYLPSLFNIYVSVKDQPGIIADLTQAIGEHRLNICEIEILHVREDTDGAIRIAFASQTEQDSAWRVLTERGFSVCCDGDKRYAES